MTREDYSAFDLSDRAGLAILVPVHGRLHLQLERVLPSPDVVEREFELRVADVRRFIKSIIN